MKALLRKLLFVPLFNRVAFSINSFSGKGKSQSKANSTYALSARCMVRISPSIDICLNQGSATFPKSRARNKLCKVWRAVIIFHQQFRSVAVVKSWEFMEF